MTWELKHVEDVECAIDESDVYVVIHRVETNPYDHRPDDYVVHVEVRADLMTTEGIEIISIQGSANAVRKELIRYLTDGKHCMPRPISREHASYIGYELLRAETSPNYVQD